MATYYIPKTKGNKGAIAGITAIGAFILTSLAAWFTHIIVAISALTASPAASVSVGYGALLVLGVIFPPLGAVHGIGVWFGAW